MMVLRPSEANLGGRTSTHDFPEVPKKVGSNIGRDWFETGFLRVEGVKLEAREARRGPRRAK